MQKGLAVSPLKLRRGEISPGGELIELPLEEITVRHSAVPTPEPIGDNAELVSFFFYAESTSRRYFPIVSCVFLFQHTPHV